MASCSKYDFKSLEASASGGTSWSLLGGCIVDTGEEVMSAWSCDAAPGGDACLDTDASTLDRTRSANKTPLVEPRYGCRSPAALMDKYEISLTASARFGGSVTCE
jgi:hypothetical protein